MTVSRFFAICLFVCLSPAAFAGCGGHDLRPGLSAAEATHLEDYIAGSVFTEGNHWRAQNGDQIITLIGTMHVYDPRLDPVFERLRPIIADADLVLLEATPEEEAALKSAIQTQPELIFLTDGPTLPEMMSDAEWATLSDAVESRGVPPFLAAKFQPWYLSLLLSMPGCAMKEAAAGQHGLDRMIIEAAQANNVPMQALESYDTLFRIFKQDALDVQLDVLRLGIMSPEMAEDGFFTMKENYFEQQHAYAWELSRLLAHRVIDRPVEEVDALFDGMGEVALYERNANWMPHILAAQGQSVVVAVGAFHLTGERGLLNLLEEYGYALSRHPF